MTSAAAARVATDRDSEATAAVRRLRLLAQHSSDVLCELRNGVITYVSENTSEISGRDPADFVGRPLAEVIHPDDRRHLAPFLKEGWTGSISATFRISDSAGRWSWREARGARQINADGAYTSVLVLRDISDRMEVEQKLHDADARSRGLLAAIPDLMFRMTRDGRCLDYHANREEDLYVPPDTLVGGNILEFLPAGVAESAQEMIHRALDFGGVHTIYYSLVKHDDLLDYEARFAACGDDEVFVLCRDITERNSAERTARDASEQSVILQERSRIAQDLHDNVAQVFFGIGMAAKGALERKPPTPAMLRRNLTRIRALSTQGGREIRNAIDALSSPDLTGGLDASLQLLIKRVTESSAVKATYVNELTEPVTECTANELYAGAREALYNVIKHSGAATVAVRVAPATGGGVSLEVRDDGSGRAASIGRASSGIGLKNLIRRFRSNNGDIEVEDAIPRGLIVRFVLHRSAEESAA